MVDRKRSRKKPIRVVSDSEDTRSGSSPKTAKDQSMTLHRYFYIPIIMIFFAAGVTAIGWYYGEQINQKNAEILQLQNQIRSLDDQITALSTRNDNDNSPLVSTETKDSIATYINEGTYDELRPYLATDITVANPDGEQISSRSTAQTLSDLASLNQAKKPWNFHLDDTKLKSLQNSTYASFFHDSALIGQSIDGYIVALSFNQDGLITMLLVTETIRNIQ